MQPGPCRSEDIKKGFLAVLVLACLLKNPVLADPKSASVLIQEGNSFIEKQNYRQALDSFTEARKLSSQEPAPLIGMAQALIGLDKIKQAINVLKNTLTIDDTSLEARLLLSRAYQLDSNFSQAEEEARKAISLKVNDSSSHTGLARVLYAQGKYGLAFNEYSIALSIHPENREAVAYVTRRLARFGLVANAIGLVEKLIKNDPEDSQLHYLLGTYYLEDGKTDDAIKEFQESLKFDPDFCQPLEQLSLLYGDRNNWQDAYDHAAAWVEKEPENPYPYALAAWSQINMGELKDARHTFEIALQSIKWNPELYNDYGGVLIDCSDLKSAESAFRQALKIDCNHLAAKYNLALVLFLQNKPAEANAYLNSYIKASMASPAFLPVTALAYARAGKFDQAETIAMKVLSEDKKQSLARMVMSQVKAARGDNTGKTRELFKAVHYNPHDVYTVIELADTELKNGRYEQAARLAQQALQLSSDHIRAMQILGNALSMQKNYDGACLMLKQAYVKEPDEPGLSLDLTEALVMKGNIDEAERILKRTLKTNPRSMQLLLASAKLKIMQGQNAGAIKYLRKALKAENPRNSDATKPGYFHDKDRSLDRCLRIISWILDDCPQDNYLKRTVNRIRERIE